MGLELLTIAKEWGLGAVGVILGLMNWVIGTGKLNKGVYYADRKEDEAERKQEAKDLEDYKKDIRASLAKGSERFTEIEGRQECLPEIRADLKKVLQELAGIRAVMGMNKG